MNGSSDYISLIVFALLAVFVIWKLRSVLGTRTGNEPPPYNPFRAANQTSETSVRDPAEEERLARSPSIGSDQSLVGQVKSPSDRWKSYTEPGSEAWRGLEVIATADPTFEPGGFLKGAAAAYEMIITAFAKEDRETLRNLLSTEVYNSFDSAVTAAQNKGEQRQTTIVSVDPAVITDAHLRDENAVITVRFASKLISVARDRDGTVVEGSPDQIVDHTDIWSFARASRSRDPNWKLVATQSLA
jgi:predicted lipid-binding transport protein (Tim44 family)